MSSQKCGLNFLWTFFCCTIQHVPEADTLNLVFVLHLFVHGMLEKGIRNSWLHIPWDLHKIRNLLMQRRSQGIVNPEARARVRIVCLEGSCCSQLVWHLVHVNSRIDSAQGPGRKRSDCLETENEELSTVPYEAFPAIIGSRFDGNFSNLMLLIYIGSHIGLTMKTGNVLYEKI